MPAFSLVASRVKPEDAHSTPASPPSKPTAPPSQKTPSTKRKKAADTDDGLLQEVENSTHALKAPGRSKRQPISTIAPTLPFPTPPSTASTTTTTATSSSTPLTSTVCPLTALLTLSTIITSELTHWAHHTSATSASASYALITTTADTDTDLDDVSNTTTTTTRKTPAKAKVRALQHILETLPLRYKALALAYSDPEMLEPVVLSVELEALLDGLQQQQQHGNGGEDREIKGELEGWYDQKLFQSKKFRPDVLNMDEEIRRLDEARMEELKGLMLMVEEMKLAAAEGLVGDEALKILIEAMDEAGLNAAGLRPVRAASNDSWLPDR